MAWRKSSPELALAFDVALPQTALVERRKMFGYPAAFVNGNMFAGLYQDDVLVRLSEAEREALLASGGRRFEPVRWRVMKNYVLLPEASDGPALAEWLRKAFDYTSQVPAKGSQAAKQRADSKQPTAKRSKDEKRRRI